MPTLLEDLIKGAPPALILALIHEVGESMANHEDCPTCRRKAEEIAIQFLSKRITFTPELPGSQEQLGQEAK